MYKFFKIPAVQCDDLFDYTPTFIYSNDIVRTDNFIVPDDTIIVHMPFYEGVVQDIIRNPIIITKYRYYTEGHLHPNLQFLFDYDLKDSLKRCLEHTGDVSHLKRFIHCSGIHEAISETELRFMDTSAYVRMPKFNYTSTDVDVNNLYVMTNIDKELVSIDRYKDGTHTTVDYVPMDETAIVQYVDGYTENRLSLMDLIQHSVHKSMIIIFEKA
jgi:hypothetical protein